MEPVTWIADYQHPPGYAGMLADNMVTDKVSVYCGATAQPYGTVVASVAATGVSVFPHAANPIEGVAIAEQGSASRGTSPNSYVQYEKMSVLRRGRIWARASGACTKDAVAKFDAATGIFADAGLVTLPNARFLTTALTIPDILGAGSQMIVQVELHHGIV